METNLVPDLATLSDMVDSQSPELRESFEYTLGMLLVERGKAVIAEQHTIDARAWVVVRTAAGELFSMVKPDENTRRLQSLRTVALEMLEEHGALL